MAHKAAPRYGALSAFEGEVVGVSSDGFEVTVKTRDGKLVKTQLCSPVSTIGLDTDEGLFGAGFKAAPVVGSMCLVLTSSLGQHYVLSFLHPFTNVTDSRDYDHNYQGNRDPLRQGDISINTRSGSFMEVLASGLAQMGASDIAKTTYLPEDESIRNICQNFLISTGLGNMVWEFDNVTKKGAYRVVSRAGSDEGAPAGSLSLGDSPNGNLVELLTTNGGQASVAIDSKGNVRADSDKDITLKATQVIRQDARKIYLNSGASKAKQTFQSNFYELTTGGLIPGVPSAIFAFPEPGVLPTSLPAADAKVPLDPVQSVVPSSPLTPAPPDPPGGGSSGAGGAGRPD